MTGVCVITLGSKVQDGARNACQGEMRVACVCVVVHEKGKGHQMDAQGMPTTDSRLNYLNGMHDSISGAQKFGGVGMLMDGTIGHRSHQHLPRVALKIKKHVYHLTNKPHLLQL